MKKQRRAKGSRKQPPRADAAKGARKGARKGAAALSAVPTEALAAELRRRRSELPKLEKAARELRARLAEVEARIASLGGAAPAPAPAAAARDAAKAAGFRAARGGRPTMAANILGHLRGAGGAQSRSQILNAMASGLGREISPSLSVQVSAILRKLVNAGEADQVGRGLYAAKGAVHAAAE